FAPTIGRDFEKSDRNKVIVNSSVVSLFNLSPEEFLGKEIKLTVFLTDEETGEVKFFGIPEKFEVIGILEEAGASPQIYVRVADLKDLPIKEYQFAKVKVRRNEEMKEVREKLISMGFLVSALSDTIEQANKIFRIIQVVLGIFGVVALVVAAIGLVNTMTITLLERTNEIGIMRAIGASPSDVKWLFLGESVITGFLGGIGGIILGIFGAHIFNWLVNILARALGGREIDLFYFPFWFILFIILLSTLVGLVAGFFPARRAAKLNPLEALRYK
ncbi:MAG TPA: ABC transporter permease, partial [bacterium]|nr:ABC transporter permease [bacterium]